MNAPERLRATIDERERRLSAEVPDDSFAALLALVRAQDDLADADGPKPVADLVTGRRLVALGGSKALQLCFEATVGRVDADL